MPTYVINRRRGDVLDTLVFHAGQEGSEEAVCVFTDRRRAEAYLTAAGWAENYTIEELGALEMLQWVTQAYQQGTEYLTVNPQRSSQLSGSPQSVILIEDQLAKYAEQLTDAILDTAFSATAHH